MFSSDKIKNALAEILFQKLILSVHSTETLDANKNKLLYFQPCSVSLTVIV